jgi:hypothetical protein
MNSIWARFSASMNNLLEPLDGAKTKQTREGKQ